MRFKSAPHIYQKGELLEADSLNNDFSLARFLAHASMGRWSDGLVHGLLPHIHSGQLRLAPGVFKLNARLGWLLEPLELEMPSGSSWSRLWLMEEKPGEYSLEWRGNDASGSGLCLCRLKLSESAILRNCWIMEDRPQESLDSWQRWLSGANYIQLEYAMAASHGEKPSLLAEIQRSLAKFAKTPELRIGLLNGSLPILDYYETSRWDDALECLKNELTTAKRAIIKSGSNSIL